MILNIGFTLLLCKRSLMFISSWLVKMFYIQGKAKKSVALWFFFQLKNFKSPFLNILTTFFQSRRVKLNWTTKNHVAIYYSQKISIILQWNKTFASEIYKVRFLRKYLTNTNRLAHKIHKNCPVIWYWLAGAVFVNFVCLTVCQDFL